MKNLKKKLLISAVSAAGLLVICMVVFILNLGHIIRIGVTRGGSAVLGVPVTLENADVSLRGFVRLDGLEMGSPEGYEAPNMFKLEHANVHAKVMSLLSDEIVINEVVIDGPEITLELSKGKANWTVLLEHLDRKASEKTEEEPEEKKKMRIDHITFKNGKIHLAGIPMVKQATLPLPTVELHDIGTDKEKQSIPAAIKRIASGLHTAILDAINKYLPAEQMKEITRNATGIIGDAAVEAGKAGGGAIEWGRKSLDRVFGGKDEGDSRGE
jgi:uncharacterized protein involved in outer membrane biogenesis